LADNQLLDLLPRGIAALILHRLQQHLGTCLFAAFCFSLLLCHCVFAHCLPQAAATATEALVMAGAACPEYLQLRG